MLDARIRQFTQQGTSRYTRFLRRLKGAPRNGAESRRTTGPFSHQRNDKFVFDSSADWAAQNAPPVGLGDSVADYFEEFTQIIADLPAAGCYCLFHTRSREISIICS